MPFFKSLGRKINHGANKFARSSSNLGMKVGGDIERLGMKAGHELGKASSIGKQVAGKLGDVNDVVQKVAPAIAGVAGPYGAAVLGAAQGLGAVSGGVHQARTIGANAVQRGKQTADALKAGVGNEVQKTRQDLITFGKDRVQNLPRRAQALL